MSVASHPEIVVVGLVALAFLAGLTLGRFRRLATDEELVVRAAEATLAELVTEQTADDRAALDALPPGIEAGDVLEYAGRRGISVREAAEALFVAKARARLRGNVYRHHGRPR